MLAFSPLFTGNRVRLAVFQPFQRLDNDMRLAAIIEFTSSRRRITTFHAVLVEHMLHHRVRWTAVPPRVVVEIEPDRRNGARTDIGTAPAAGRGHELHSDFEARVFHPSIMVAAIPE